MHCLTCFHHIPVVECKCELCFSPDTGSAGSSRSRCLRWSTSAVRSDGDTGTSGAGRTPDSRTDPAWDCHNRTPSVCTWPDLTAGKQVKHTRQENHSDSSTKSFWKQRSTVHFFHLVLCTKIEIEKTTQSYSNIKIKNLDAKITLLCLTVNYTFFLF